MAAACLGEVAEQRRRMPFMKARNPALPSATPGQAQVVPYEKTRLRVKFHISPAADLMAISLIKGETIL
jgi:hypothetical protein